MESFSKGDKELEDKIESFVVGTPAEEINKHSRIILLARGFDATLYSLGNWLFSKGVAFRCIKYQPVQVGEKRFLSFSVAFDRSPDSLFPLGFSSATRVSRTSGYFWHNIGVKGVKEQEWWNLLQEKGQISAGFDAAPGDHGEEILRGYIKGDTIFAYASGGYGAVGYGIIENPGSYELLEPSDDPKDMNNLQLHRLGIQWVASVHNLSDGIPHTEVKANFGIPYPVGTYAQIKDPAKAEELKSEMDRRTTAGRWKRW